MASLYEVERIYLDPRAICHVVSSENAGCVFTLCGTMATGDSLKDWPLNPRICRECRKRLKKATVIDKAQD